MSWEKEFEDKIYFPIRGDIILKNYGKLNYLYGKYLGAMCELEMPVKIKCKDGCIQIERINK